MLVLNHHTLINVKSVLRREFYHTIIKNPLGLLGLVLFVKLLMFDWLKIVVRNVIKD